MIVLKKENRVHSLVTELKARELAHRSDHKSNLKSYSIYCRLEKSTDGEAYFSVDSQSRPGMEHIVILQAPSITDKSNLKDLIRILKKEDVKVACSCEAFLYQGYKYITYKADSGIDPEDRFPIIRNPSLRGMLCKHILAVFKKLAIY